jgi:sterol desaturase/sphingolipid hydroxylase (fatty acid hydroxylase superfamily)
MRPPSRGDDARIPVNRDTPVSVSELRGSDVGRTGRRTVSTAADLGSGRAPGVSAAAGPASARRAGAACRRLYLPTAAIAAVAGWLAWRGWSELGGSGVARSVNAGRFELAGPVVLGFVLAVVLIEQARPAVRRPLLARGHLADMVYLLAYALVVVPLIVLIGAGFSGELARLAPWLAIPRLPGVPQWCFIALAVLAIDLVDWLAHLGNHRITSLWRLHAVHHSQEELSILTTFRAHPLVHVSFLISAIPILAISSNAATPTAILTVYACLGALPHANVRWTYGRLGKIFISPAYHRIHHQASGRIDINLGTVFAAWDMLTRRAIFPVPGEPACVTGLSGRPVPVEQDENGPGLARTFLTQWAEPFATRASSAQSVTATREAVQP